MKRRKKRWSLFCEVQGLTKYAPWGSLVPPNGTERRGHDLPGRNYLIPLGAGATQGRRLVMLRHAHLQADATFLPRGRSFNV